MTGLAVIAVGLLVAGCRDEEQHRRLGFSKGEYAGPKAEEPSPQAIAAARKRLETQNY